LLELALPSIRLLPGTGRSHLGGTAELPLETEWPDRNGSPLSLIAQLFLDELVLHDHEGLLPRSGSLVFFYDAEEQPLGFDPADRWGFAVVFVPPDAATEDRSSGEVFPRLQLAARAELTLPPDPTELELDEPEQDAYFDVLAALSTTRTTAASAIRIRSRATCSSRRSSCPTACTAVTRPATPIRA
jgi:hypothetical protein